jgi:hypothetical protein
VKRVGLDLFQQWALAFQSKPELSYVSDVYRGMKSEGELVYILLDRRYPRRLAVPM